MKAKHLLLVFSVVLVILLLTLFSVAHNNDRVDKQVTEQSYNKDIQNKSDCNNVNVDTPIETSNNLINSLDFDGEEARMLMKIAMAEAGGEGKKCMALVMLTVLNRTWSESFPNNIHDVIYEKHGNTYQFTPIMNGAYDKAIPSEECHAALQLVMSGWNESRNALYFESCQGSSWHSRNLEFLYQVGHMRFYK